MGNMDVKQALEIVLDHLRLKRKATNTQLLRLIGGDEALLREVRETLILEDLVQDKNGVGLIIADAATLDTSSPSGKARLFLSYGRKDGKDLAERLADDLRARDFEVWLDTREISSGTSWQHEITDGLRSAQIVIALLSPHSVRTSHDADTPDGADSVCLGEIAYALFQPPSRPVVPVMAVSCEPPLAIFHLDYVDLTRWRDSPDQYETGLKRLIAAIESARQGKKRYRSWHHQLQPWDFAAFLHEKRRNFIGRQWLFDEIDAWRTSTHHERALLITGDPGTGKSAIVAELVHRNPNGQVIAYHCCQSDTPATLEPWRFVRSIAAMIASRVPEYATQLSEPSIQEMLSEESCRQDPAGTLERAVLAPLETLPAPSEGVRYVLVDALDEALTLGRGLTIVQLLASRLNRLPGWLRIVATTRKEPEVINRLRGLRAEELDAQDPRNQEDIGAFLRQRLRTPNLTAALAHTGYTENEVFEALFQKSEGNFLYVRQALDGLESGTYAVKDLDALPEGLSGLYDAFFRRQFGEDGEQYAGPKRILEVLVAAREPLTLDELAQATQLHPRRELPTLLNRLSAFVPARPNSAGHITYAAFHKSLTDWLTDPNLWGTVFSILPEEGHQRLAAWGQKEWAQGGKTLSPYHLRHHLRHLIETESWDNVEAVLASLSYLERRNEAGQLFELVRDFDAAVAILPANRPKRRILRMLGEAIRRDIHFIAQRSEDYPQGLFQCLWNTGWWYDCPEAAQHYDPPEGGWSDNGPPWAQAGPKLYELLEQWRKQREEAMPGFPWLRSLQPPRIHLGTALMAVLRGHEAQVICVAPSLDGTRIVSGSRDGHLRVWDAVSGAELAVLHGHEGSVWSVAFSPDETRIASGSSDQTVRLWDSTSGEELIVLRGHEREITSVAFSPNGLRMASGSRDQTVRVWDATSGAELAVLKGHQSSVLSIAFSPDGTQFASSSGDRTIRIWDAVDGTLQNVLHGHQGTVNSVAYSPDGLRIVTGSGDRTVRVWDVATGSELSVFEGHKNVVLSVAYAPHSQRIVSGSGDRTVRTWDALTGTELAVLRGHEHYVTSVAFTSDGTRIVSGSWDQTIRVWDAQGGTKPAALKGHERSVWAVAYSPDGTQVASGAADQTIRIWDTTTGLEVSVLRGHEHYVTSLAYSPDGTRIVSGSRDKSVRAWNVASGEELKDLRRKDTHWITSVAYSPDGTGIVAGTEGKVARQWDAVSQTELAVLQGHEGRVWSVAYSPDGTQIATGSGDKTIHLWDGKSGTKLRILQGHKGRVWSVAYSPDGRRIASASADGTVRTWDVTEGTELALMLGNCDIRHFFAEGKALPLRVRLLETETLLEDASSGTVVARFSTVFSHMASHPSKPQWAGANRTDVVLFAFEGQARSFGVS